MQRPALDQWLLEVDDLLAGYADTPVPLTELPEYDPPEDTFVKGISNGRSICQR
jgi:hypothetical protein